MTLVCKSLGIGNSIFNPIYESEDKTTLVCKSFGIGNNIFNPIYESGDKITNV